jgi:hypothetical protein
MNCGKNPKMTYGGTMRWSNGKKAEIDFFAKNY